MESTFWGSAMVPITPSRPKGFPTCSSRARSSGSLATLASDWFPGREPTPLEDGWYEVSWLGKTCLLSSLKKYPVSQLQKTGHSKMNPRLDFENLTWISHNAYVFQRIYYTCWEIFSGRVPSIRKILWLLLIFLDFRSRKDTSRMHNSHLRTSSRQTLILVVSLTCIRHRIWSCWQWNIKAVRGRSWLNLDKDEFITWRRRDTVVSVRFSS